MSIRTFSNVREIIGWVEEMDPILAEGIDRTELLRICATSDVGYGHPYNVGDDETSPEVVRLIDQLYAEAGTANPHR